jgi:hypothetical protein
MEVDEADPADVVEPAGRARHAAEQAAAEAAAAAAVAAAAVAAAGAGVLDALPPAAPPYATPPPDGSCPLLDALPADLLAEEILPRLEARRHLAALRATCRAFTPLAGARARRLRFRPAQAPTAARQGRQQQQQPHDQCDAATREWRRALYEPAAGGGGGAAARPPGLAASFPRASRLHLSPTTLHEATFACPSLALTVVSPLAGTLRALVVRDGLPEDAPPARDGRLERRRACGCLCWDTTYDLSAVLLSLVSCATPRPLLPPPLRRSSSWSPAPSPSPSSSRPARGLRSVKFSTHFVSEAEIAAVCRAGPSLRSLDVAAAHGVRPGALAILPRDAPGLRALVLGETRQRTAQADVEALCDLRRLTSLELGGGGDGLLSAGVLYRLEGALAVALLAFARGLPLWIDGADAEALAAAARAQQRVEKWIRDRQHRRSTDAVGDFNRFVRDWRQEQRQQQQQQQQQSAPPPPQPPQQGPPLAGGRVSPALIALLSNPYAFLHWALFFPRARDPIAAAEAEDARRQRRRRRRLLALARREEPSGERPAPLATDADGYMLDAPRPPLVLPAVTAALEAAVGAQAAPEEEEEEEDGAPWSDDDPHAEADAGTGDGGDSCDGLSDDDSEDDEHEEEDSPEDEGAGVGDSGGGGLKRLRPSVPGGGGGVGARAPPPPILPGLTLPPGMRAALARLRAKLGPLPTLRRLRLHVKCPDDSTAGDAGVLAFAGALVGLTSLAIGWRNEWGLLADHPPSHPQREADALLLSARDSLGALRRLTLGRPLGHWQLRALQQRRPDPGQPAPLGQRLTYLAALRLPPPDPEAQSGVLMRWGRAAGRNGGYHEAPLAGAGGRPTLPRRPLLLEGPYPLAAYPLPADIGGFRRAFVRREADVLLGPAPTGPARDPFRAKDEATEPDAEEEEEEEEEGGGGGGGGGELGSQDDGNDDDGKGAAAAAAAAAAAEGKEEDEVQPTRAGGGSGSAFPPPGCGPPFESESDWVRYLGKCSQRARRRVQRSFRRGTLEDDGDEEDDDEERAGTDDDGMEGDGDAERLDVRCSSERAAALETVLRLRLRLPCPPAPPARPSVRHAQAEAWARRRRAARPGTGELPGGTVEAAEAAMDDAEGGRADRSTEKYIDWSFAFKVSMGPARDFPVGRRAYVRALRAVSRWPLSLGAHFPSLKFLELDCDGCVTAAAVEALPWAAPGLETLLLPHAMLGPGQGRALASVGLRLRRLRRLRVGLVLAPGYGPLFASKAPRQGDPSPQSEMEEAAGLAARVELENWNLEAGPLDRYAAEQRHCGDAPWVAIGALFGAFPLAGEWARRALGAGGDGDGGAPPLSAARTRRARALDRAAAGGLGLWSPAGASGAGGGEGSSGGGGDRAPSSSSSSYCPSLDHLELIGPVPAACLVAALAWARPRGVASLALQCNPSPALPDALARLARAPRSRLRAVVARRCAGLDRAGEGALMAAGAAGRGLLERVDLDDPCAPGWSR